MRATGKRFYQLAVVLMAIMLVTVGCASSNSKSKESASATTQTGSSGSSDSGKKSDPIKLVMWGGVPAEAGPQAVVDNWNKEHPDIQVEYVRFVNDDDGNLKLDTALMTGQSVDLYVSYSLSRVIDRANAGFAVDLGQFSDYNILEKVPGSEDWTVDGKFYGIPTKKTVTFVAMNKDLLDQAGLSVPTEWTWDDLKAYSKALTADGRYGFAQHMDIFFNPLDAVLEKDGYVKADGTSNMDNPYTSKWLETLNAMMHEDKSTPTYGEQITSKMTVENMFLNGEVAMVNMGEWLLRSSNNLKDFPRDFKIAFAPVPRLVENAGDHLTQGGLGDMVSINPKSENVEAAWEFLKWYTDGGMMPMAAGGRFPASAVVDQTVALESMIAGVEDTYDVESLKYVLFNDPTPIFVRSLNQEVIDSRRQEYEKFFLGNQNVEQTVSNMVKRHNDFLKK